jgi:hypothetical protein
MDAVVYARFARCAFAFALFAFVFVNPISNQSPLSHLCSPVLPWPCLGTRTSLAKFVHDYDENVIVRLQFDCASLGQRVCDGLMSVQVRAHMQFTPKFGFFSFHFSKKETESKKYSFFTHRPHHMRHSISRVISRMPLPFRTHAHTRTYTQPWLLRWLDAAKLRDSHVLSVVDSIDKSNQVYDCGAYGSLADELRHRRHPNNSQSASHGSQSLYFHEQQTQGPAPATFSL